MRPLGKPPVFGTAVTLVLYLIGQSQDQSVLASEAKTILSKPHKNAGFSAVDMFPGLMDPTYSMLSEALASQTASKYKVEESRKLQSSALSTSDLTELNEFLEGLIIKLPDKGSYPQLNFTQLPNLNLATSSFSLKEIKMDVISDEQAPTFIEDIADDKYNYAVQLRGLDLTGVLDFEMDLGLPLEFLQLCGTLRVEVKDCKAKFDIAFKSEDLDVYPPSYAELDRCRLEINVELMKFSGENFLLDIFNQFESLARIVVEPVIESTVCDLIRDSVSGSVTSVLGNLANAVDPYTDPNFGKENDLIDSEVVAFQEAQSFDNSGVDFSNTDSPVGGIINFLISLVDQFLSSEVEDTENPDGESRDLGVNTILRSNVLDDRKFIWEEEIVIFENNTSLDTKLTLERAEVLGLDTFTSFNPLQVLSQTLSSNFEIPSLKIDIILKVDLDTGSNTENDALLLFIPTNFTDRVSISIEFTEIFLNASAYVLIDEDKLENIQLGSFLNTTNLLPCSLASMKDFRLDDLEGTIGINTPRIDRFIDPAIGLLLNNIFDAISFMSDAVLANAFPRYISTTGKQNITDIVKFSIQNITSEQCPTFSSTPETFLDFRDLLLEEQAALEAGASGTLPYGDVCPFVKKIIDENFVLPNDEGSPTINSLVSNATMTQSGIQGAIILNQTVDLALCLPDLIANFGLLEFTVENLDTFDYPFEIFSPTDSSILSNRFVIGSQGRPLRLSTKFSTSINSTSRELNEYNEFSLTIELTKLETVFAVVAKFYEENFMQFPVNNIANVDCWLASLPDFRGSEESALGIDALELSFEELIIDLECIDCNSQRDLPMVLDILKSLDGFGLATRSLITLLKEFILSIGNQESIKDMIHKAPKKCPHHPAFEGSMSEVANPLLGLLAVAANGISNVGSDEGESVEEKEEEEDKAPICIGLPSGGGDFILPFSRDAHESIIFLALLVVEMVVAAFSLSTVNILDFIPSNPLLIQESLSAELTDGLLDISNLNSTFLNWLDGPLKQGNATVSNLIDDPTHENGKDIGANVYIRRVLDEDGSLTIPINFELNSTFVKMPLSLNHIKLEGLDSFKKVVLMKMIGPQTLQSEFELETLDVELSLSITSPGPSARSVDVMSTPTSASEITENITLSFALKNINFDLGLFLGIVEESFRTFKLGAVFDTNQIIPCLMTVLDRVSITRLLISVGGFENLKIDGFLSNDIKRVIENFQSLLFDSYEKELLAAIPILSDGLLREIANDAIMSFVSNTTSCNLFRESSGDGFVDFRDLFLSPDAALAAGGTGTQPYGNIWSTVYGLAKQFLFDPNENGVPKISDILIGPLTSGQSNETGTLIFKEPLIISSTDLSKRFRSDGFLNVTALYNTTVRGLTGINNPLVLLNPVGAHLLNNSFSFGSRSKPVEIATSANLSVIDEDGFATTNTFDIAMTLPQVGLEALLKAKIDERAFMGFPFEDVVNVDCWIASLPSRELDEFGFAIQGEGTFAGIDDIEFLLDQVSIEITCRQCDDPELEYYAEMFTGVSFAIFTESFLKSGAIQNVIDKSIFSAVKKCPHSPEFDPLFVEKEANGRIFDRPGRPDSGFSSTNTFIILIAAFVTLATITYCGGYIVNRSTKRKHAIWLSSLSDNDILSLYIEHNHEREQQKQVSQITKSMFRSNEIPAIVRYGMPLIVLMNIGLFVSGHLNLGATINVSFSFAGQPFNIDGLYTYAILSLVEDMWRSAIKALAVFVFIASVLWPYTKQTVTFFLWFAPPKLVSVERRGAIYRYLDFLAKWSMIDIFIIIIGLVVFRVELTSGPNFPDEYFGVDLIMVPLWGLYANALAQFVSQISSHLIIYYQDKITMKALLALSEQDSSSDADEMSAMYVKERDSFDTYDQQYESSSEEVNDRVHERKEALCNHSFYLSGAMRGHNVKIRKETNFFIAFIGLLQIFCTTYGSFARYLRIDMTGVFADLISAGNDGAEPVLHHSVITVAQTMLNVGDFVGSTPVKVGVFILSFIMIATCVIVPVAQCLCVLTLWFLPFTPKKRSHMISTIEILKAWQYLEVYFLGTLVMMWQANPISEGLILIVCFGLIDFFIALAEFGVLDERDARCFLINASLELSVVIHIAAGVLLWWLTRFVSDAIEQQGVDMNIKYKVHGVKKESKQIFGDSNENDKIFSKIISDLVHLPVRFTDAYPWATQTRILRSDSLFPPKGASAL